LSEERNQYQVRQQNQVNPLNPSANVGRFREEKKIMLVHGQLTFAAVFLLETNSNWSKKNIALTFLTQRSNYFTLSAMGLSKEALVFFLL
jgi:hypothetical protein